GSTGGTLQMNGNLDEMKIWDFVKTSFSDRFAIANGDEAGLLAYYAFDENIGSHVTDRSINSFHGSINGDPVWQQSNAGLLTAPVNLVATVNGSNQPQLDWDDVAGVLNYVVERSENNTSSFSQIGTPSTSNFGDATATNDGAIYYYRVFAFDGTNNSQASDTVLADIKGAGNALVFNGIDDHVDLGTSVPVTSSGTEPYTISTWVKLKQINEIQPVIYVQGDNSAGGASAALQIGTNLSTAEFTVRNALNFDGSNDFVEIPNSSAFNLGTNLTFEAWIRTTDGLGEIINNFEETGSPNEGFTFVLGRLTDNLNDGIPRLYVSDGTSFETIDSDHGAINDGAWHHIAVTYDGSNVIFYEDGVAGNEANLVLNLRMDEGVADGDNTGLTAPELFDNSINALDGTLNNFTKNTAASNFTTSTAFTIDNFEVTNTNDTGAGSLRQAITDANSSSAEVVAITFNISGSGPWTITPATELPIINTVGNNGILLDGTSQPGWDMDAGNMIVLDGTSLSNSDVMLQFNEANVEIYGLHITNMPTSGVGIQTSHSGSQNFAIGGSKRGNVFSNIGGTAIFISNVNGGKIQGNRIGTQPDGLTASSVADYGIRLGNTSNITIGGDHNQDETNIIANCGFEGGIAISTSNTIDIFGNLIGLGENGTTPMGNQNSIVLVSATTINIGSAVSGTENVIAGATANQEIEIDGTSGDITISHNNIGVDADGNTGVTSSGDGIRIATTNSNSGIVIEHNTISGLGGSGVVVQTSANTSDVKIRNNKIGTNTSGTGTGTNLANAGSGIFIAGNGTDNTANRMEITDNVISGNGDNGSFDRGIDIQSSSNILIQNNKVGTETDGVTALGNIGDGLYMLTATNVEVSGNIFAYNGRDGIFFDNQSQAGSGVSIGVNSWFCNSDLAIDFENAATVDSPVISSLNSGSISGTSTAADGSNVEIYAVNASCSDGQGATHVATASVSSGSWTTPGSFTVGDSYVATVNDVSNGISEFSTGSSFLEVTNTNDTGTGSLREAITSANGTGNVTIAFNIGAAAPWVIPVGSISSVALPPLTGSNVTIDGTSQPGWDMDTDMLIELDGAALSTGENGIDVDVANVSIYGLKIVNFPGDGIEGGSAIAGTVVGASGKGNVISGNGINGVHFTGAATIAWNRIGTNAAGTTANGNGNRGVALSSIGSSVIDNNLISGNGGEGIYNNANGGHTITNNFIGTNALGTAAIPNDHGISLNTTSGNVVTDNLISGNTNFGITNISNANSNEFFRNRIGTDIVGTGSIPNGSGGIVFRGNNNTIGRGTPGGEGNIISNNNGPAISITNSSNTGNTMVGNSISNNNSAIDLSSGANAGIAEPTITSIFGPDIVGTSAGTERIHIYNGDGNGQGVSLIDSVDAAGGAWSYNSLSINPGDEIVVTATDANGTSEFVSRVFPIRNALEFDGADDHVVSTNNADLQGDVALSLSAWVNVNSLSTSQTVVFLGNAATTNGAFSMFINTNGAVSAELAGSTTISTSAGVITAGQWYHITITKSTGPVDTGVKIYVNGVDQGSLTSNSTIANNLQTGPIYLGQFGAAAMGFNFNGKMDEVVVWDRELSAGEVNQLATNGLTQDEDGIYAFYDIEACSGTSLPDLSGNNFAGTLTNFGFMSGSDWDYTETLVGAAPTTQSSGVTITEVEDTGFTINWANGSGKKKMVFLKQTGIAEIVTPTDGVTYLSDTEFGAGTELSPNFHAVYDGYGTSVSVTGLQALTDYRILIFEYNDCVGNQRYNTTVTEGQNATNVQTVGVKRLSHAREFRVNEATQTTSLNLGVESILVPEGMTFNEDGSKLYIVGSNNNNITEFTLGTPFDVTTGTNTHVMSINSEDGNPRGIAMNAAGTRLFMVGSDNDRVYMYLLSTPYDLSTASYSGDNFYIGSEDLSPQDIAFDLDGNNMYIGGGNSSAVYQYALSTPNDLLTATYSGNSLSTLGENGLVFTNDGSVMIVADAFSDRVYQYDLSSNFDISTGVLNDIRLNTASIDGELRGLTINEQATKFYLLGSSNDAVFEFHLPTAAFTESALDDGSVEGKLTIVTQGDSFVNSGSSLISGTHYTVTNVPSGLTPVLDVSAGGRLVTVELSGVASPNGNTEDVADLQFTFTGAAFQSGAVAPITNAVGYSSNLGVNFIQDLKRLDYSVSQDISGAALNQSFDLTPHSILVGTGLEFNTDGSRMFVMGSTSDKITAFTLSTPFDVSTASFLNEFDVSLIDNIPAGFAFSKTGTVIFMTGSNGDRIYEIRLTEPFDLTTAFYTGVSRGLESGETTPLDIAFNANGTKFYLGGSNNVQIFEYDLGTAYDLSTATYSSNALTTLGQDGLVFNANGSQLYVINSVQDRVYQYDLSVPFDITSGTYSGISFDIAQDGEARALDFNSAGTKMYIVGASNDNVYEYDLSAFAFNETAENQGKVEGSLTIAITGDTFAASGPLSAGSDFSLTNVPSGLSPAITVATDLLSAELTFTGTATAHQNVDDVLDIQFTFFDPAFAGGSASAITNASASSNLGINFSDNDVRVSYSVDNNVSSAIFNQNIDIASASITVGTGLVFTPDGTQMFISGSSSDQITSFTLTTAFDISTATVNDGLDVSLVDDVATGITFNRSGTIMLMAGSASDRIYEFRLTDPYDIGTASYSGVTLTLEPGEASPLDVTFNNSGSKLYVGGSNGGVIYEYDLATNYDLSTAAYSGRSLNTIGQDGVKFNASGTKLFVLSSLQDRIYQYDLSTPFDVSTGVYNGISLLVSAQDGEGRAIALSTDGTRLYMIGTTSDDVFEYHLPAYAFKETSSNDGMVEGSMIITVNDDTFINGGATLTETTHYDVDNLPGSLVPAMAVSTDGSYATLTLSGTADNHQNVDDFANLQFTFQDAAFTNNMASAVTNAVAASSNLGINFDDNLLQLTYATKANIATAKFNDIFDLTSISALNVTGLAFGDNGNKAFLTDQSADRVYELALAMPYDISTASLTTDFSITNEENNPTDIAFNDSGSRMFIVGTEIDEVIEFELTTPFDLTTASFTGVGLDLEAGLTSPTTMAFADFGSKLYVAGSSSGMAYEYNLSTPYDITTAVYSGVSVSVIGREGLTVNADGTRLFVVSSTTDLVYQYDFATPFDLSTLTYSGITLSVLAQDATPRELALNPSATKMYMVGTTNDDIFEYDLDVNVFQESSANDGTVLGELIITLEGDTFINGGGTLTPSTHYTVNNLPAGLTPTLAVDTDGGVATLSLSGSATNNQNADDVTDLQFTFTDIAFTNNVASSVGQAIGASSNLRVNFDDNVARVIYATKVDLASGVANDLFDLNTISATAPDGLAFSRDGMKVFVVDGTTDRVYELSLSAAYDVSTASLVTDLNIVNEENNATDIAFNDSGSRMFIIGTQNDQVREYALTTAFDLSTASYTGKSLDMQPSMTSPVSLEFGAGGTKLYTGGSTVSRIHEYDLSTAFDISTATFTGNDLNAIGNRGITFNGDGTRLFTVLPTTDLIYQFDLSTPWDLSTASNSGITLSTAGVETQPEDIALNDNGTKLYIMGSSTDDIHEFDLNAEVFTESAANDGSVGGELVIILEGDQFTSTGASLSFSSDYTVDVPTGLTSNIAVNVDGYAAVLSYSGNATSHQVADDVANILFTFNNSAFAGGNASLISNVTSAASGYSITFMDNTVVNSINRAGADPTNAGTVSWDVQFSGAVSGLTSANFTLAEIGLTGSNISNVSDVDGLNWTVTATVGSGDGSLGLDLTDVATGLTEPLAGTFVGQTYTIDQTPPTTPTVNTLVTNSTNPMVTGTFDAASGSINVEVSIDGGSTFFTANTTTSDWDYTFTGVAEGTYDVIARTSDAAGNLVSDVTTNELTVDTTNPNITAGSALPSIVENNTTVESYTADETVTWSLSGTDASFFNINSSGDLTFLAAPDFETAADGNADNVYDVTVTAQDAATNTVNLPVAVTVTDLDEISPNITGGSPSPAVAENTTFVDTYTADEAVTWTITGGDDASLFQIDAGGNLSFLAAPDYEAFADFNGDNLYDVIVTATDGASNTDVQAVTVILTDVDENPPVFESSTPSISGVTINSFDIDFDLDETGDVHYVVVADGATAPTSLEVQAGTGSGGTGQVTFGSVNYPNPSIVQNTTASGLAVNTPYDVYVVAEDALGNLQATPSMVNANTLCDDPVIGTVITDNTFCTGANGQIDITPSTSGVEPSAYGVNAYAGSVVDVGNEILQNASFTGLVSMTALSSGNYTIEVTNNDTGCQSVVTVTVNDNLTSPSVNTGSVIIAEESLATGNDGSIDVSGQVTGGSGSYTYQWYIGNTNSTPTGTNSPTLTGLTAGNYSLEVTDATTGCVSVLETFAVSLETAPVVTLSDANVLNDNNVSVTDGFMMPGGDNDPVYRFNLRTDKTVTVSGLTIPYTGTLTAGEIVLAELRVNKDENTITQPHGVATATGVVSAGSISFTFSETITGPSANADTLAQFWVSLDLSASATVGNTFRATTETSDLTFASSVSILGSITDGGLFTVDPYCDPRDGSTIDPIISGVTLLMIDQASTADFSTEYTYYPSFSANMTQGGTYTLLVDTEGAAGFVEAWIDWNQDGDFADADELVSMQDVAFAANQQDINISISAPVGATVGSTRMRVIAYTSTFLTDPTAGCSSGSSSEIEDYPINVAAGDFVAPAPVITSVSGSPTNVNPFSVQVDFGEQVFGFNALDVSPTNGAISNFVNVGGM
ncbi:unnamed protein product, partial [Symbiodinium sp. KB8]